MSNPIHIKNDHFFLASYDDVDEIVRPLKEHFDITSFVYQANYNDGSEIRLSNQPAWLKYFFAQGFSERSSFEKHPNQYRPGMILWSSLTHHRPILDAARTFNIDHGVTLIKKIPNGVEYFFLGTTPDKPYVPNLLLNNSEFLSLFTIYFKDKADDLIKKANKNKIFIPNKYQLIKTDEPSFMYQENVNIKKILKISKYPINETTSLSPREVACAKLLLQGKSARLIAEELFISPRTVETHLEHVKNKLNCSTKAELINRLIELNLTAF